MPVRKAYRIAWGRHVLDLGRRTCIMGVLNVTPDSFSDGGRYLDPAAAVAQGVRLAKDGADIIDVGGESTRPFSDPVTAEEEIRRVVPVIAALAARLAVPISIDTTKSSVARRALEAGAASRVFGARGPPAWPWPPDYRSGRPHR
ncbi:MAG: dihydropteroate synthase, partial [Bacteroidales bacterium]